MASDALLSLIATPNTAIGSTTAPTGPNWTGGNSQQSVDLKTIIGSRRTNPLVAYVLYSALGNASGTNSVLFTIDHSDDNTNWFVLHTADQGPLSIGGGTPSPTNGQVWVTIARSKRYIRLNAFISGSGSTPTVTLTQAVIRMAEP